MEFNIDITSLLNWCQRNKLDISKPGFDPVKFQFQYILDNSDWKEVFKYASNPTSPEVGTKVNEAGFSQSDISDIFGMAEGENDGEYWLIYGKLHDGRYFSLRAGCDYTGWG